MIENSIQKAVTTGVQRVLQSDNPDKTKSSIKAVTRDLLKEDPELAKLISFHGLRHRIGRTIKKSENSDEATMTKLSEYCEQGGIPISTIPYLWDKTPSMSLLVKNPLYVPATQSNNIEDVLNGIIKKMQGYSPVFTPISRIATTDPHLLVIDPADVHIGKLCKAFEVGEEYNSQIAVQRVKEGVVGILSKAIGFNIEKILYIAGNDKLHIDTPKRQTTSGTPQDTDGMWYDSYMIAFQLDVEVIEMLRQVAPVHIQYDPSNHDYTNGFFLVQALMAWFRNCPDVTFNATIAHRKYFQYGENLIGSTHGDGAKTADLPLLMAQEAPKEWYESKHRYFYVHHLHHKISKDYGSVCVETLRSPSGTDSWHHRNGYQHAPKAIEGYIHHPKHGQVSRFTHLF